MEIWRVMKKGSRFIQEGREDRSLIMYWEVKTQGRVRWMRVEERIDSDHQPVTVWVEGGGRGGGRKVIRKKREGKGVWTEEEKKRFEEYFGKKEKERGEGGRMGEIKEESEKEVRRVRREGKGGKRVVG